MGNVFYQSCSIDANCNILSVVASNGHDFGQILFIFFYCFNMLLNVLYFSCRALCGGGNNGSNKKKSDDLAEKKPDEISKLDVKFFSFTTFYYMVLISSD